MHFITNHKLIDCFVSWLKNMFITGTKLKYILHGWSCLHVVVLQSMYNGNDIRTIYTFSFV